MLDHVSIADNSMSSQRIIVEGRDRESVGRC